MINNETIGGIFALGGVALGWLLSEATGWIKAKRRARMLKRALIQEIDDARGALKRVQLEVEKSIQLVLLGYISTTGPIKFPTHIHTNHFAEASLQLSQSERISFNSIYYLIDTINSLMDRLQERVSAAVKEPTEQNMRDLAGTLELLYSNSRHAMYNINYHRQNQKNLDMFAGPADAPQKLDEDIQNSLMEACGRGEEFGH
jgi:hypothetical protein